MEKSCRKCTHKVSPRPLFIFGKKTLDSHCMQEILLKTRYFERGSLKSF